MNLLKDPKGRLICIIAVLVLAIISSFIIKTVRQSYFDTFVSCEGVVTEIEWFKNYPEKIRKDLQKQKLRKLLEIPHLLFLYGR